MGWFHKQIPENVDAIIAATIKELKEKYGCDKIGAT
jgi:hypothetical protein